MTSTSINDSSRNQQPAVLTEVPEDLEHLLLTLVKTFYGPECYTVFNYIQKKVILKDEELRDICKIDMRQLKKFLVTLKVSTFLSKIILKLNLRWKNSSKKDWCLKKVGHWSILNNFFFLK